MPTKYLYFLYYVCGLTTSSVFADHSFNFAVNSPGSPPYLYLDISTDSYKGLIPDLLNEVSKQHNITFNYVDSSQQRIEVFFASGKIDVFFSSEAWLEKPHKLINSRNITAHKIYLYSTRPFDQNFTLLDINNSRISPVNTIFIHQ